MAEVPARRRFYMLRGGHAYHRDRWCSYLRGAATPGRGISRLLPDPGLGAALTVDGGTAGIVGRAEGLTACPRCGV